jgi:putative FmdB family regulatory protein
MPTYEYYCDPEDGGCGNSIEIRCSFEDKESNKPKSCRKCRKRKALREVFGSTETFIPKTLGSLMDKNSDKMSADEKHHLHKVHNAYKESKEPSWIPTDKGMVHKNKL